jgi:hypothetical protein
LVKDKEYGQRLDLSAALSLPKSGGVQVQKLAWEVIRL